MDDINWELFWNREGSEQTEEPPRSPPKPCLEDRLEALEEEHIRLHNGLITLRDRLNGLEKREEERPRQEGGAERRRQGRRGRVMGFVAGLALAWMITALAGGGLLLGWRAVQWTAGVLDIPPLLLVGLMTLLLLGSLLLKESKTVTDWFLDGDDDPWDEWEDDD